MNRRHARIAGWSFVVVLGLYVAAWATLRALGFGSATVVVTNVGRTRVETVTIAEVSESVRDLLREHGPFRLEPGASVEVDLERARDAKVEVRLRDPAGDVRRVLVDEYLSHGKALAFEVDVAEGTVREARVRRSGSQNASKVPLKPD